LRAKMLMLAAAVSFSVSLLTAWLAEGSSGLRTLLGLPGTQGPLTLSSQFVIEVSVEFIVGTIVTGFIILSLASTRSNLATRLRAIAPRVFPLFLARLLVSVLTAIGLILFIIPGIFIILRLLFVDYAIVVERAGLWAAFRRSLALTSGGRFFALLTYCGLVFVGLSILAIIVAAVPIAGPLATSLLLVPFTTVFLYACFCAASGYAPRTN
jgi:hypothetical protein